MPEILFLTELLGLRVYDVKHHVLGRVKEAALVPLVDSSRVDRFLIGAGTTWLTVRYDQVKAISLDGIALADEILTPYHSDEYMLRLVRDLLDQQIIDAHGRKVVRVTDVTFEVRDEGQYQGLHVTEVDIGLRSIFRRLMQGALPPRFIRKLQGPIPPNSISWEYCNIIETDPMRRLRLNITPQQLEAMHPADLADIVEELGPDAREAVITTLDSEAAAETLSEVDPGIQASILESLEAEKAAEIIEEMSPDEAADILQELQEETSEEILEEMEAAPQEEVRELMEYEEDTAGGMMTTEYVAAPSNATVEDAVGLVRQSDYLLDGLNSLVVVDEQERLLGLVPVGRMLVANPKEKIADLISEDKHWVHLDSRRPQIVEIFDKYSLFTLPVLDESSKLAGVITADDVITLLRRR